MPQRLTTLVIRINLGFDFVDDGETAVDFFDDAFLFSERRNWDLERFYIANVDMRYCASK